MPVPPKDGRLYILEKQVDLNARRMRQIILKARERTETLILRYASKGNFIAAATIRDNLYKQLAVEYETFQGELVEWEKRSSTRVAREWRKLGIADLPKGAYKQSWSQFSRKYLLDITGRIHPMNVTKLAAVNAAVGGMLQQDILSLRRTVIDVNRVAAATGMTAREARKELMAQVLEKRAAFQFIDKAGRQWESKNYFNMLNRTLSHNVARESYVATINEAGYDLATIEGGVSMRTCDFCIDWAGVVVSTTGATQGYPTLADAQAGGCFHPRCRHYLGVILPGELPDALKGEKEMRQKVKDMEPERKRYAEERRKKEYKKRRATIRREKKEAAADARRAQDAAVEHGELEIVK